jgi:hypothetical protein
MSSQLSEPIADKTVAVMQPYLFPYLGYFQLIDASDVFVFYNDVDFITQGWINRNRILVNGKPNLFTVPCSNASQNEKIEDVLVSSHWRRYKLLKKIRLTYSNADEFDRVFPLIEGIIQDAGDRISALAEASVRQVSEYLDLDVDFYRSSDLPVDHSLGRATRLIELTKHFDASTYVNMEGGKELYEKSYFADRGVTLNFLIPNLPEYTQYTADDDSFHPGLSIIDVMMNVDPEKIQSMLKSYQID